MSVAAFITCPFMGRSIRMNGRHWSGCFAADFFNITSLMSEMRHRRQGKLLWIYVVYRCKFYRQVLVLMEPSSFFHGVKNQKFTMGPMGFFSKANLRDGLRLRKIKKIVTHICGVGAGLV